MLQQDVYSRYVFNENDLNIVNIRIVVSESLKPFVGENVCWKYTERFVNKSNVVTNNSVSDVMTSY